MTKVTVTGILASAVATAGTFAVSYPSGYDRGNFAYGVAHKLSVLGKVFTCPEDITLSFGATSVTVTYNGSTTLPQGSRFTIELDSPGAVNPLVHASSAVPIVSPITLGLINLGSPGTADADGYYASAALTAAAGTGQALTGALVSGGVGIADARTGRNVVAAWTGTAVLTVRGYDMYGNAMTESSASGTSFTGKKAFKRITSISVSADVTALTVGTGDVLGIPVYLPNTNMVLKENVDGAAATAGTLVAGLAITTKPTATNADVRGTYDPNAACDGSKHFQLVAALPEPEFLGATQYSA